MLSNSKSTAGKLGGIKTSLRTALLKEERIANYNLDPVKCKQCNKFLSYEERRKQFCGSSCSATYNNFKRERKSFIKYKRINKEKTKGHIIVWNCTGCGIEKQSLNWKVGKFCSTKCQQDFQYKEKIKNWNTKSPGKGAIKRYLTETVGYKCSVCGIDKWNEKSIVLELEHKDGNSENNSLENVCLIFPNFHIQTDTYKAKNKGNGRFLRRQRYAEGKSY